jgi:hypothetical protein
MDFTSRGQERSAGNYEVLERAVARCRVPLRTSRSSGRPRQVLRRGDAGLSRIDCDRRRPDQTTPVSVQPLQSR